MNADMILKQSKAAYKQWAVQWREQAKANSKHKMRDLIDFENIGVGRAVLCIANGYSFEENIATIKRMQGNVDIICCDKTLGHCLNNGIIPTYCLVCDANVSYEKYLEPYKEMLYGTILLMNVCANPKWADEKWKSAYFFANEDILKSHIEFMELSKCPNKIPAATNVSNAMVVFLTRSDNSGRCNFFGYDKILLIGYDYSWRPGKNYYSFDKDGGGKHNYMRHSYTINLADSYSYTSGNLAFSADWLEKYIKSFKLNVIQCSKETILNTGRFDTLENGMKYRFRTGDAARVKKIVEGINKAAAERKRLEMALSQIGRDHWYSAYTSM